MRATAPPLRSRSRHLDASYAWFAGSLGSWVGAAGMQQVLFSWLVIGELRVGAEWVGTAQMCQSLPAFLFLLVGGVTADRRDPRQLLMLLHVAAGIAAGGMALVVGSGSLGLSILLIYALCWGTIQSFAQPARDALLSEVSGGDLMRAVTAATLIQFAAAALGSGMAGRVAHFSTPGALGVQAGLVLSGLVLMWRLPIRVARHPSGLAESTLAAIGDGLREVWRSPRLRPIGLLVAADGLFYMGPFAVLCPLMVRDVYHGGVQDLSLIMMAVPIGTICGSGVVLLRGGIRRKGRAFLIALLGVALCLVTLGAQLPLWGFVAVIFCWGIFHSIFFNTSRTLFQETAPPSHRARVLSIHSLGLLGMAPFSNLAAGFLATLVGPLVGCALAGGAMILIVSMTWIFTNVRHLE